jgi:steroid delta-isomerase-like uncharacterized protein
MATNVENMVKGYYAAWNSHDVERIISFFTEKGVYEDVAGGLVSRGKKEISKYAEMTFVWSPDVKFEMKSFFSAGDWIGSEWLMKGTHKGDIPGLPATGKRFSIRGASVTELRKGKISRNTDYWNMLSFLQQVGLLPETPSQ